ncbi:MAG: RICIN domain-containing protein [Lachnospiraceae bacterium]|nr:RICIN domain-containing protein [Lachnospiraceae bacterium]
MKKIILTILTMATTMALTFFGNASKADAATVSNGTYKIVSALNNGYVIDVVGGSTYNGANIQIHQNNNTNAQRYWICKQPDGSYTFECVCSGKLIDCAGAGKTDGTNIQQHESNNTAAQRWELIPCGNGYYYIKCKANGLMMDVTSGVVKNGNNVQMYHSNNTASQKFKLVPTSPVANAKYVIASGINGSYVWDIEGGSTWDSANLQLYLRNDTGAQVFSFELQPDGYYMIKNVNSGKVVDCAGAGTKNGTNLQQFSNNRSDAQRWQIIPCGGGYFYLKCKANGLMADCTNGQASNNVNLQMYQANGTASQKFKLTAPGTPKPNTSTNTNANTNMAGLLSPLKGTLTRSSNLKTNGFYCDYKGSAGTPVYAPDNGTVVYKQAYATAYGKLASYGNHIVFTSSDGVYTIKMAHLSSFNNVGLRYTSSMSFHAVHPDITAVPLRLLLKRYAKVT